jgi:voltage-gated potassium channel
MAQVSVSPRRINYVYHLFIFALTVFSLIIMVALFLPLEEAAIGLLQAYDTYICLFFFIDFLINLKQAPNKSRYFLKEGGWLDLIGSIPSPSVAYKFLCLLRLARLSRLRRIAYLLRGTHRDDYVEDVLENRTRYTAFITIFFAISILASASVLVVQFESASPDAVIKTGWDAFWYSVVTITTVGYGDFYPVTFWGRVTAIFIMLTGVGIIGALASLLSSVLLNRVPAGIKKEIPELPVAANTPSIENELASIKFELAELRRLLEKMSAREDE